MIFRCLKDAETFEKYMNFKDANGVLNLQLCTILKSSTLCMGNENHSNIGISEQSCFEVSYVNNWH